MRRSGCSKTPGIYAPQVLALYPLSRYYSPDLAFRTVAADSDTVCPGLVTEQELARYMPVYGYEMDDGDPPPNTQTVPAGAQHASDPWDLSPTTGLDANMQVLQQQEIAYVATFGRTGHPTALQQLRVLGPAGSPARASRVIPGH
jgi:para-nitrobenzyl esterase